MNGMDMMVNAVLKATGFDRAQFDTGVATAKSKAANFEARFDALERNVAELLTLVRSVQNSTAAIPTIFIQRDADAQVSDHAG